MNKQDITQLFDLRNRVAIVTGSSKGIGAAIARGLAAFGARVVVSSRQLEHVEPVAESIHQEGGEAMPMACHVGDATQREALIQKTYDIWGSVDILVNNAAVNPYYGPIEEMESSAYRKTQDINTEAALQLSNLAFPIMREQQRGSIIHISSIEGLAPGKGMGAYSISKAALNMLTKSQAYEWGRYGIRVNTIAPGLIKTKFSSALWQNAKLMSFVERRVPAGRAAEPEEMVGLAVFLASDAASYCTGGVYVADGGFSLVNLF